jgi:ElaB/YqjD/DUF883 family membrane-anchored ribosome-binding protein
MSEHNPGAEANGNRASQAAASGIGKIKDQLAEVAGTAGAKLDSARQSAAGRLHDAAKTVRQGGEAVAGAAQSTAKKLAASADYLDSHDAKRMMKDLMEVVKKHPGRSILIAGVVGFLIARTLRSSRGD